MHLCNLQKTCYTDLQILFFLPPPPPQKKTSIYLRKTPVIGLSFKTSSVCLQKVEVSEDKITPKKKLET